MRISAVSGMTARMLFCPFLLGDSRYIEDLHGGISQGGEGVSCKPSSPEENIKSLLGISTKSLNSSSGCAFSGKLA